MADQPRSPTLWLVWKLGAFLALIGLGHLVALALSAPVLLISDQAAQFMLMLIAAVVVLAFSAWLAREFDGVRVGAIGIGFDRPWIRHLVIGVVAGAALITIVWLIFGWFGWSDWQVSGTRDRQFLKLVGALLYCAAIAAHEELLFRGYAFQLIARRNLPVALILGGILFAAYHMTNKGAVTPVAVINLVIAHLLFSACYLKTRSLWLPFGLHASWNFTSSYVLGLPFYGSAPDGAIFTTSLDTNTWTGHAFIPEGGLLVTLVFVVATLLVWFLVKQRRPAADLLAAEEVVPQPAPRLPAAPESGPGEPPPPARRILAIDVLRGLAILGILPMNMQLIAMFAGAALHPYAGPYTDTSDVTIWVAVRLLIGSKDLAVFSMLFGAGILIIDTTRRNRGENPTHTHLRRMTVLLVFGLIHSYAVWAGDILFTYALCGFIIYVFRRMKPSLLITLGMLVYAVPMLLLAAVHFVFPDMSANVQQSVRDFFQPTAEIIAAHNELYRGSWVETLSDRASASLANQTLGLVLVMGPIAGGMMLVGMGLYKLGIFFARKPDRSYVLMIALGLLLGYPLLIYGFIWSFARNWRLEDGFFLGWCFRESAYAIINFAWIGAVMLVCKYNLLQRLTGALGAIGRLALSNYLLQTILCSFMFYGHGLGLVGKVDLVGLTWITLAIWLLQLIASPIWLKHFRYGPVEWLWRSLTDISWKRLRTSQPTH